MELVANFELSEGQEFDALFEINANGAVWGTIDGDIENQTDLYNILLSKADFTTVEADLEVINNTITENYETLDEKIDTVQSDLSGDIESINTAIQNETAARAQNDSLLQSNIDTLSNNLTAEISNRENADSGLQTQITNLSGTISSNYTILDTKIDTTETTLQGNIDTLSNTVSSNYTDLSNSINSNVVALNNRISGEVSILFDSISTEETARQNADNNLQSQIDAITAASDVTDIVGTYAQLQAYDTSALPPNSIIKVLQDENQNNETTYYRWVITNGVGAWVLIGEEGPYYTKSESDSRFVPLTRTINNKSLSNNITLTASDVGALPSDTQIGNATITLTQGGIQKGTFTTNQTGNATIDFDAVSEDITVDSELSTTSENPVQNKVITNALNSKVSKSGDTISGNLEIASGLFCLEGIGSSVAASTSRLVIGSPSNQYAYLTGNTNGAFGIYSEVSGSRNGIACYPGQNFFADAPTRSMDLGRSNNVWKMGYINTLSDGANSMTTANIVSGASAGATALQSGDDISKLNNDSGYITSSSLSIYGVSDSAATDIEKTVSIPSITTLKVGTLIIVQPTITSTVANSELKLNNFPSYPMRYNNAAITTSTDNVVWSSAFPSFWLFDGEYWVFAGHGVDTNTTYTLNYSVDSGQYTAGEGAYAINRYALIAQKANGTWERLTRTSLNYNTATTKVVNTNGFILNQIRYYYATANYGDGALIPTNYAFQKASSVDLRYSTNCGNATTWSAGDYIYLVGTMGVDGLFYLDTTQWWTNELPITNDGKLYIRLGLVLADNGYTMSFFSDRPIFYHNGTKICEYKVADNKQDTLVSGTNIKTVNSTSLLGSGNVAVQPTLVSGTNIKTVNNTSLLGSGNIDTSEVFIAEYNITSYADVLAAYNAGKAVYVHYTYNQSSNFTYEMLIPLVAQNPISGSTTNVNLIFQIIMQERSFRIVLNSSTWNVYTYDLEKTSNKVTSLSSSSTNTQYPSAKCVYDNLATKQNSLTFDSAPTSGSTNPVTSGGIYTALSSKASVSVSGTTLVFS